jgi:hypothetical protein
MPSSSKKQRNFMAAAAHNPAFAKKVGISQKVAKEFNAADKGKKFGTGGDVNYSYGGKGQANKQRTRFGSSFGYKLNAPDSNNDKYAGLKTGGAIREDLQKVNKKETDHGDSKLFKKGGVMKTESKKEMREEMKVDTAQDKQLIKKAFAIHDKQEHKGGKGTNLAKLKKGGCATTKMCGGGKAVKKMAKGGGCEVKGKTKGRMV